MAIGSEARKQILATDRVIFALAALLKSEVPASVQFQVVVAIRAVMHNSLDRQIRLAQQPGIMDDLKALLPPPTFFIPQSMGSLFSSKVRDRWNAWGSTKHAGGVPSMYGEYQACMMEYQACETAGMLPRGLHMSLSQCSPTCPTGVALSVSFTNLDSPGGFGVFLGGVAGHD